MRAKFHIIPVGGTEAHLRETVPPNWGLGIKEAGLNWVALKALLLQ